MFRNIRIQKKVFMTVSVFLLIIILTIVSAFCIYIYKKNMEQEKAGFIQTGEIVKEKIQSLIETMNTISSQIVGSATIQEEISHAYYSEDKSFNYFDNHVQERNNVRRECAALNISKNGVDQIYFYQAPQYFLDYTSDSGSNAEIENLFRNKEWQESVKISEDEYYNVILPHENKWSFEKGQIIISLIRPMTATYTTKEVIGTLEVTKSYESLVDACELPEGAQGMRVLLFDLESGEAVYPYREIDDSVNKQYIKLIEDGTEDFYEIETDEGTKEIIYSSNISNCNWKVVVSEPYTLYMQPVYRTFFFIGILCLVFLIFVFVIVFFISQRLTKPIAELRDALKNVDLDNMEISIEDVSNNEIELLRESFQKLLIALKKSSNSLIQSRTSEIQAKLMALQSAINPHFLYNSIMAIGAAGQEEGNTKVEQMCMQLSRLFRYSSEVNEKAYLSEELEILKIYLEFMKERYLEDLYFEVQGEGNAEGIIVPKMILQPIVENCFTHSFRMSRPPYVIKVKWQITETGWQLSIIDNGCGFTQNALELLHEIKEKADFNIREKVGAAFELQGKAVMNVYVRLKMAYKENTVFILRNKKDEGAEVILGGTIRYECREGEK